MLFLEHGKPMIFGKDRDKGIRLDGLNPAVVTIGEDGKPMIYGKDRDKGIRLNGLHPEIVTLGENGVTEADLLVHDETAADPYLAYMLSRMWWPDYPVPVGVLRRTERPTHDQLMTGQITDARARQGDGDLAKIINGGETWVAK